MAAVLLAASAAAAAAEVGVVGLFPGKALVVINNGQPRTLSAGAAAVDGVRLISVESDHALLEVDGKRRSMTMGGYVFSGAGGESVNLRADARGQFFAPGTVNGTSVRFIVDTGASYVALGAADAARAGVDMNGAQPGISNTANGPTRVWMVRLKEVKVGAVILQNVEAIVHEHNLPVALLGMSFLKHVDMQRNGEIMTLKKTD